MNVDELNQNAMQILLQAGDARNYLNEIMKEMLKDEGCTKNFEKLFAQAEETLTNAHRIQTIVLQNTIECSEIPLSLLFIHAQDTLMTAKSEFNMMKCFVNVYLKKIKGVDTNE